MAELLLAALEWGRREGDTPYVGGSQSINCFILSRGTGPSCKHVIAIEGYYFSFPETEAPRVAQAGPKLPGH